MADSHPAPLSAKSALVTLYALGSNGNYQLGLPHDEDTNHPQKCVFNVPHTFATHTSTLTSQSERQVPSYPAPTTKQYIPLSSNETIKDLKAGGNHTLLLTSHGHVFAAGSNEHGQLALLLPSSSLPSSSSTSTALPTTSGFHLLPWTGPSPNHTITHIAATFTASMLVSSHTTLYVAGHGPKGELGLGSTITSSSDPTRVFDIRDIEGADARITALTGCMDHVLILSNAGVVYGFGASRKGQLGDGLQEQGIVWKVSMTDMHLDLPFRVAQIATGRDFSVVAGRRSGEVKAFGKASAGFNGTFGVIDVESASKFANGKDMERSEQDIDGDEHTNIGTIELQAGWSSVTIQNRCAQGNYLSGLLMKELPGSTCVSTSTSTSTTPSSTSITTTASQQRNPRHHDRGQLPPASLSPPHALAVGSEHSVAIVSDADVKKVVSWGWGEHGNCGSPVDERGIVGSGVWNVLFDRSRKKARKQGEDVVGTCTDILGVGAGCGSSFFWVEDAEKEGEQRDMDSVFK